MSTSKRRFASLIAAFMLALPVLTHAQTGGNPPPISSPTLKIEGSDAPEVEISQPDTKTKMTEKKQQGKVTQVKVQTGHTTYYVKPNDTPGAMRGDAQSDRSRPTQFQIGTFGHAKERKKEVPAHALPPPDKP